MPSPKELSEQLQIHISMYGLEGLALTETFLLHGGLDFANECSKSINVILRTRWLNCTTFFIYFQ